MSASFGAILLLAVVPAGELVAGAQATTPCGRAPAGLNVIVSNASTVRGTDGDDFICVGGGDNLVLAGAGNDVVFGGRGGRDVVRGGDGRDILYLASGPPRGRGIIVGGQDRDVCIGPKGMPPTDLVGCEPRADISPLDDRVLSIARAETRSITQRQPRWKWYCLTWDLEWKGTDTRGVICYGTSGKAVVRLPADAPVAARQFMNDVANQVSQIVCVTDPCPPVGRKTALLVGLSVANTVNVRAVQDEMPALAAPLDDEAIASIVGRARFNAIRGVVVEEAGRIAEAVPARVTMCVAMQADKSATGTLAERTERALECVTDLTDGELELVGG